MDDSNLIHYFLRRCVEKFGMDVPLVRPSDELEKKSFSGNEWAEAFAEKVTLLMLEVNNQPMELPDDLLGFVDRILEDAPIEDNAKSLAGTCGMLAVKMCGSVSPEKRVWILDLVTEAFLNRKENSTAAAGAAADDDEFVNNSKRVVDWLNARL